jgi:hypothetical protein
VNLQQPLSNGCNIGSPAALLASSVSTAADVPGVTQLMVPLRHRCCMPHVQPTHSLLLSLALWHSG